jgi:hypothetical protein
MHQFIASEVYRKNKTPPRWNTYTRRITTGICSEKWVVRRFRFANVYLHKPRQYSTAYCTLYLHKPRQYSTAYYTHGLYGIAYCS